MDATGARLFAARHLALSLVALLGREAFAGSPHLSLRKGSAPVADFQVDRSVLGNMKARAFPVASEGQQGAMNVQISRAHSQIAEISLGTPPQKMRCLIDSGSSDLWVPSKRCQNCDNAHYFLADASSTFKPDMSNGQPREVKISYGSGTVVGYSVRDTLRFGSATLPDQAFIIVENAELPPDREWDGICGLGWEGLAQVSPTLYKNLQSHGHHAAFSIIPSEGAQAFPGGGRDKEAHMLMGDVPSAVYKEGTLTWVDAEPYGSIGFGSGSSSLSFWVVSGGLRVQAPQPIPARFLVDTGTNQVLLVPKQHYQDFIRSLIPSDRFDESCGEDPRAGVVCDCSLMSDPGMRPLQIQLGEHEYKLPLSKMFVYAPATSGGELCVLTIQPNTLSGGGMDSISDGISSILGGLLGALGGDGVVSNRVVSNKVSASPSSETARRLKSQDQDSLSGLLGDLGLGGLLDSPGGDSPAEAPEHQDAGFGGMLDDLLGTGPSSSPAPAPSPSSSPSPAAPAPWPSSSPEPAPSPQEPPHTTRPEQQPAATPVRSQPSMTGEEPWMIGGMFLENFVTVFDFDNRRMGMAEVDGDARRRLQEAPAAPAVLV